MTEKVENLDIAARLINCATDPMWANHAEVSKTLLSKAADYIRALESRLEAKDIETAKADGTPRLKVWYGSMPESNGKSNFTAILYREDKSEGLGGITNGITLDRSEYPERVRYEADRARYLIGEIKERPCVLDYDENKHSGYLDKTEQVKLTAKQHLSNLLARIHRDGGHYEAEHGTEKAVADADIIVANLNASAFKPIAKIAAIDEYGPRLEWNQHWVGLGGQMLYIKD